MNTRPYFPLRRDLGGQLLFLFCTFVAVVLAVTFLFLQSASQELESDVATNDLALAHAVAEETRTFLDSALVAVRQLSTDPSVINSQQDGMYDLFQHIMSARSDINLTYRLDAYGVMYFHYPIGPDSTVGFDFSFRPYFQRAMTTHDPLISAGRISPTTQQPVATAVMPIWLQDGSFQGLVATNLKLQFLSDTLTNIIKTSWTDGSAQIAILDNQGQVVAHSDTSYLLQNGLAVFPLASSAVMNGDTGNLTASAPHGDETLYSYVPIPGVDWGVIVSRPTAAALAVPIAFRQGTAIVSAVFLLSGLIFWGILSRRVIQPLERLAAFSQNVGLDHAEAQSLTTGLAEMTTRTDQMGVLTRSLKAMQEAIEARLNELSTLLKTSTAVVSTLDSQVVLERILEQVNQLVGVRMSAIFVLDEKANIFRVRASRNLPAWYAEKVRIDPQDPNSLTMRAVRGGEPLQVSDTEVDPSYEHNRTRAQLAGYRSLLAIRLPVQHVQPSALLVYRSEPYTFSEREIRLLTSFANHATMAIENAALFARSDMHLQEQTRRLEALIQSMHDGVVLENSQGKIVYANRSLHDLLNLSVESIHDQSVQTLVDNMLAQIEDVGDVRAAINEALSSHGIRRVECAQKVGDHTRYLRLTLFSVTDHDETLIGRGWIIQDITQRHEVDRMKSSLIATVSHELRTPLAAIKGFTTTLLAEDVEWDRDSQREFLNTILQETDRLSGLVQDLLDMSRIEAGSFKLKRTLTDLHVLVDGAAYHANPQPGQRLQIQMPSDLPALHVDPQRIEAVLRNLIENAAKYCPEDTRICLSARTENGNLIVSVADEGPGIPPGLSSHIFESFYRIDNGLTRKTAGAGLGLAIARGFVQAHGGQIWLEPRQKGTCVTFSLPLESAE